MPSRRYSQVGVYYNKFLCGELVENEENYTFKYNESYVEQKLPVISHNFPLQVSEFPSDGKSLHPFFDNLASEGWLRQHQATITEEYPEIIELEFLSMLAVANLLPDDSVCEIEIG